jgi:type II secretory pathway pseudopilin PulG
MNNPIPVRNRQSGFSLAELLVSLLVTSMVLVGTLTLLNFSSRVARVQGHVTDMQQSLRIAQYDLVRTVRMAGRGPLPAGNLPDGFAVAVRNNVPAGETLGGPGTPAVLAGTDVLTVRGVFDTPIYRVQPAAAGSFRLDGAGGGTVTIQAQEPANVPQDLTHIRNAIAAGRPEALLLVSPENAGLYAVVELNPAASLAGPTQVTVGFRITGGVHTASYGTFSPAGPGTFPPNLASVAFVGLLEEHRFYVRDERAQGPDGGPDLVPRLARARIYPGTNAPWAGTPQSWRIDIADNILDLQVALGLDTPAGGCTVQADEANCSIAETANGADDDWLYNSDQDAAGVGWAGLPLHYVRLTTLARTDRRDLKYQAPLLARLEDHGFAGSPLNDPRERLYRRRVLQTVIDMRNL